MRRGKHEARPAPETRPARWSLVGALLACTAAVAVGASGSAAPVDAADDPGTPTPSSTAPAPGRVTPAPAPSSTPTSPPFATAGNGRITPVVVGGPDTRRPGRIVRWSVEAEQGLGIDREEFAEHVRDTLQDPRGWERVDRVRFERVPTWQVRGGADVDIRITLASPRTTDRLCAPLQTRGKVSCWHNGRAVINSRRWVYGAPTYRGRLTDYRTYVVNHEVGHGLGHGHETCRTRGRRAPIMLQQTLRRSGCRAWPYPADDGSGRRSR